jgi:hypothetical protein
MGFTVVRLEGGAPVSGGTLRSEAVEDAILRAGIETQGRLPHWWTEDSRSSGTPGARANGRCAQLKELHDFRGRPARRPGTGESIQHRLGHPFDRHSYDGCRVAPSQGRAAQVQLAGEAQAGEGVNPFGIAAGKHRGMPVPHGHVRFRRAPSINTERCRGSGTVRPRSVSGPSRGVVLLWRTTGCKRGRFLIAVSPGRWECLLSTQRPLTRDAESDRNRAMA